MINAASAKNQKINNMLNDFEKTKTFNQELMKNFGSPKGPIFNKTNVVRDSHLING